MIFVHRNTQQKLRGLQLFSLYYCSLQRYEDSISPFRLNDEQTSGDIQELKRISPWKISNKDMEFIKPKVCVCVCLFGFLVGVKCGCTFNCKLHLMWLHLIVRIVQEWHSKYISGFWNPNHNHPDQAVLYQMS